MTLVSVWLDWTHALQTVSTVAEKNYSRKNNNQKQRCMLKSDVGIDYICLYFSEYVSLGILLWEFYLCFCCYFWERVFSFILLSLKKNSHGIHSISDSFFFCLTSCLHFILINNSKNSRLPTRIIVNNILPLRSFMWYTVELRIAVLRQMDWVYVFKTLNSNCLLKICSNF